MVVAPIFGGFQSVIAAILDLESTKKWSAIGESEWYPTIRAISLYRPHRWGQNWLFFVLYSQDILRPRILFFEWGLFPVQTWVISLVSSPNRPSRTSIFSQVAKRTMTARTLRKYNWRSLIIPQNTNSRPRPDHGIMYLFSMLGTHFPHFIPRSKWEPATDMRVPEVSCGLGGGKSDTIRWNMIPLSPLVVEKATILRYGCKVKNRLIDSVSKNERQWSVMRTSFFPVRRFHHSVHAPYTIYHFYVCGSFFLPQFCHFCRFWGQIHRFCVNDINTKRV